MFHFDNQRDVRFQIWANVFSKVASQVGERKKKQRLKNSQAQLTPQKFPGPSVEMSFFLKTKICWLVRMDCPKHGPAVPQSSVLWEQIIQEDGSKYPDEVTLQRAESPERHLLRPCWTSPGPCGELQTHLLRCPSLRTTPLRTWAARPLPRRASTTLCPACYLAFQNSGPFVIPINKIGNVLKSCWCNSFE